MGGRGERSQVEEEGFDAGQKGGAGKKENPTKIKKRFLLARILTRGYVVQDRRVKDVNSGRSPVVGKRLYKKGKGSQKQRIADCGERRGRHKIREMREQAGESLSKKWPWGGPWI